MKCPAEREDRSAMEPELPLAMVASSFRQPTPQKLTLSICSFESTA